MAEAGWYPDPASPVHQRYWDGAQWTTHVAPLPGAPTTVRVQPRRSSSGTRLAIIVAASNAAFFATAAAIIPLVARSLADEPTVTTVTAETPEPTVDGSGSTDAMDTAKNSPLAYLGEDLDSNPVWELRGRWGQVAIPDDWRDVTADALEEDPDWYGDYLGGAWTMDGGTREDSYESVELMIYADDAESASVTLKETLTAYYVDEPSGFVPSEVIVEETSLGYEKVFADFSDSSLGTWIVLLRPDGTVAEFWFTFDEDHRELREGEMASVLASFRFSD